MDAISQFGGAGMPVIAAAIPREGVHDGFTLVCPQLHFLASVEPFRPSNAKYKSSKLNPSWFPISITSKSPATIRSTKVVDFCTLPYQTWSPLIPIYNPFSSSPTTLIASITLFCSRSSKTPTLREVCKLSCPIKLQP